MKKYILATVKSWHIKQFEQKKNDTGNKWILIKNPHELTLSFLHRIQPRYVFFPHWSWKVPDEIIDNFECICFHSSDLPYGRGGSPIQNLIIRGLKNTKVTALRMVKELDAGPVYMKAELSLVGRAQDIYKQSAITVAEMIEKIIETEPTPIPQKGQAVIFKRRQGDDNILPRGENLEHLYNHIRMLDADSYPLSHVIHGEYLLEFSQAEFNGNEILAKVRITKRT